VKDNSKRARERRHNDAVARQAEYDALSLQDKIDKVVHTHPGESKRELARLNKEAEALGWKQAPDSVIVDVEPMAVIKES
jgi:hypothetical protein